MWSSPEVELTPMEVEYDVEWTPREQNVEWTPRDRIGSLVSELLNREHVLNVVVDIICELKVGYDLELLPLFTGRDRLGSVGYKLFKM